MIAQKVALVTGASRGIGNAIAERLSQEGYAIAAVSTSDAAGVEENLDRIRRHNQPFIYIRNSIATGAEREEILNKCLAAFGRLDVLVNNAGVAPKARLDLLDLTEESMDHVLGINLKGTFFLTQLAARQMVKELEDGHEIRPIIINISSISAYTASINRGEYCISKAGVSMLTSLFAERLAEYGINVYEIRPGIIRTDMTAGVVQKYDSLIKNGLTPFKRWGTPEDVADAVSVLCSGKLSFSTGEVLNVDGGFHIRRL
jgi:NAD(P)-dependent dehydrogenase (short-subunit alcohol dehydrogenase family)